MIKLISLVFAVWCIVPHASAKCDHKNHEDTVIIVVGDSLSSAYGIEQSQGWVSLMGQRLNSAEIDHTIVNASISGDTTVGGMTRLKKALPKHQPDLVIIELGGNDGLRGIPLKVIRSNLKTMIEQSLEHNAKVVLLGMRIPTNYGPKYTEKFHAIYQELSAAYDLPLVDFFMQNVALDDSLMQADGIHPNADAQAILLDTAWPAIEQGLVQVCASSKSPFGGAAGGND